MWHKESRRLNRAKHPVTCNRTSRSFLGERRVSRGATGLTSTAKRVWLAQGDPSRPVGESVDDQMRPRPDEGIQR